MTVIVAARGYPATPASGGIIRDIEAAEQIEGVTVFHAGTAIADPDLLRKAVGSRGYVRRRTFANARARAYRAVDQIDFADGFHRRDIGWRELVPGGRVSTLWPYFWPSLGAGAAVGIIAGLIGFRNSNQTGHALAIGALASIALAALWHGPLGAADRFSSAGGGRSSD